MVTNAEITEMRQALQVVGMNINKLQAENKQLRHEVDTTHGLWCIDKDPKEVDLNWIRANAFQLKEIKP